MNGTADATRASQLAWQQATDALADGRIDVAGALAQAWLSTPLPDTEELEWRRLQARIAVFNREAEQVARAVERCLELTADDPHMLHEASHLLQAVGLRERALALLERLDRGVPGNPDVLYALGTLLYQLHRDTEALDALRRANGLAPRQPAILRALAEVEFTLEEHAAAHGHFAMLHGMQPQAIDVIERLARCALRMGDPSAARAWVQRGSEHDRDDPGLLRVSARIAEDEGKRDTALAIYRRLLDRDPMDADALAGALLLAEGDERSALRSGAAALVEAPHLGTQQRAYLYHAVGKSLDADMQHAAAFHAWTQSNAALRTQHGGIDRAETRQRVRVAQEADWKGMAPPAQAGAPRIVWIVGMPRSGTTLTEQILAAHPAIHGCGELTALPTIATRLLDGMPTPDPQVLQSWAQEYLADAQRHAPAAAKVLVDKHPYNFFNLGLASALFPDSRVVWCRRNPRDLAISIYGEFFSALSTYATDLGEILELHRAHEALMRHWQALDLLPIMEMHYEDTVVSLEKQARRLVAFAGVEWSDDCLDFHRSSRVVQTNSRWQVRQPLHARSVQRWRRYLSEAEWEAIESKAQLWQ